MKDFFWYNSIVKEEAAKRLSFFIPQNMGKLLTVKPKQVALREQSK